MHFLTAIASMLGIEVNEFVARFRQDAVVWGTVGALALVAVVFVLVAANAALTAWIGPIYAPLAIAGTAALIGAIVYLVHASVVAKERRREAEQRRAAERTALITTAASTALPLLLKSPLVRRFGLPAAGAIAAFYLLTRDSDDPPGGA